MLFPFRTSSIFRSRWMALLWAAGVVWMAMEFAGSGDRAAQNDQADNAALVDQSGAVVDVEQMKQAEKLLAQFGQQ
ncbi:MAG: hypothetical protein JWN59_1549 [Sphingomonas bacterium]|nr:hypothetical protein [Sphingomonas bacterium]